MASITKSFDVKIKIIRPFITKNLSEDDLSKIKQNTALKYESLKTTSPEGSLQNEELSSEEVVDYLAQSAKELDELYQGFDDLARKAEEDLKSIVYTYDITDPANELIADAEIALFGSATGIITLAKYKKVMAYEEIVNREIQEKMVENGGMLDGVA